MEGYELCGLGGLAEFERDLIRARTSEGRERQLAQRMEEIARIKTTKRE